MSNTIIIEEIPVRLDNRARSIKIKADTTGNISVSAHPHTPKFLIKRFILQQQAWIDKHRARSNRRDRALTPEKVSLFGREVKRTIFTTSKDSHLPGIYLMDNQLAYFPANPQQELARLHQEFDQKILTWLRRSCHTYISHRAQVLAKQMGVEYQKITLKTVSSRWGSCSLKGNLNFNWRLIHFAPSIIDYVIIHELAHRVHMNHSRDFWQLVAQHDPKFKYHRRQLEKLAV